MKRLLVCALLSSWALSAGVAEVQSVYLLPMPGGLDQYLANRLSGMFKVVTDPKLADAVFTSQLGEVFEQQLAKLYPPPAAPGVEPLDPDKDGRREAKQSTFGRGKGTIFLVDVKSRAVIWSGYQKSDGSTPETLDRTATRIVQQIKKAK
jgi:hypothetical protein